MKSGEKQMWWIVRLIGLIPLCLGSGWIYVFGFTDYRAHRAGIGLPLGIVFLLIGVILVLSPGSFRWIARQFEPCGK